MTEIPLAKDEQYVKYLLKRIEQQDAELQKYRQAEAEVEEGIVVLRFERQPNSEGGWTISTTLLKAICQNADANHKDYLPSWEAIETVLLALEKHFCDIQHRKTALAKEEGEK